jgi:hypothetical protein
MFSTEKTKMCWKLSAASWTLAKSFWESSLPFLSVWVRWTTLARLDLGILAVLVWDWGGRMRSEKKFEFAKSQAKKCAAGKRANTDTDADTEPGLGGRGSSSGLHLDVAAPALDGLLAMLRR